MKIRELRLAHQHLHQMRDQQEAFRKLEDQMKQILAAEKGAIQEYYGDLSTSMSPSTNTYAAARARQYGIQYSLAPRVLRIRIDLLRGLKNKIPRGRYVVMVSLHERLGGAGTTNYSEGGGFDGDGNNGQFAATKMKWSRLDAQGPQWSGVTAFPQRHEGKFHSLEMSFAQNSNRVCVLL